MFLRTDPAISPRPDPSMNKAHFVLSKQSCSIEMDERMGFTLLVDQNLASVFMSHIHSCAPAVVYIDV